jgi:hypothetical protein
MGVNKNPEGYGLAILRGIVDMDNRLRALERKAGIEFVGEQPMNSVRWILGEEEKEAKERERELQEIDDRNN